MANTRGSLGELMAMGVIAGLMAFLLSYAARPRGASKSASHEATVLDTRGALFELHAGAGRITVRSRDGALATDIELSVLVDGAAHPLALARSDLRPAPDALRATVPVPLGDAAVDVTIELRADLARDALLIDLGAPPSAAMQGHTMALRAEVPSDGHVVFVSGVGPIADRTVVHGGAMTVDDEPHPLGLTSTGGSIGVESFIEDPSSPIGPMRLAVTSPAMTADGAHRANLAVAVGATSASLWGPLTELSGRTAARVQGHVTGTGERALVFGRDAQGNPQVRARTSDGIRNDFSVEVPTSVVQWYAATDPGRASGVASFVPGTPRPLLLDVSPGGDLRVSIRDPDTGKPLTARLLVRGIDGTIDPSFGPDYRASGAGPVIDSLHGEVSTPLPSGRYRVSATKGIEWTIDATDIEVTSGRVTRVELAPRHVVSTPGIVGCDLHVHARPSFDAPVTPEDRVLSLVAAGIDFAVPTEHNIVGDYSSAIETLNLNGELATVTGVEVTTYSKGFGHFGTFPYPPSQPVPPFVHTTPNAVFRAVRAGDPNRYFQLNHPRLPGGIGYFSNIGFEPGAPRSHIHGRIDFDGIEVFNGYDEELPERVDQVLRDYWALLDFGWRYAATGSSDSHRIQYHWAGYPRTMVTLDPRATPESDTQPVDPLAVVANIKKGHATVTDGPVIGFDLAGTQPGDEVVTSDSVIRGHLRVQAAPWVDVSRIEIIVGQIAGSGAGGAGGASASMGPPGPKVVETFAVPSRPAYVGPEPGSLAEAQARAVRFDEDIEVPVGPNNGWVQVIVRGDRRMSDVLPFMPVPPLGFTNPVYVVRHPQAPPPFPIVGRRTPARVPH